MKRYYICTIKRAENLRRSETIAESVCKVGWELAHLGLLAVAGVILTLCGYSPVLLSPLISFMAVRNEAKYRRRPDELTGESGSFADHCPSGRRRSLWFNGNIDMPVCYISVDIIGRHHQPLTGDDDQVAIASQLQPRQNSYSI